MAAMVESDARNVNAGRMRGTGALRFYSPSWYAETGMISGRSGWGVADMLISALDLGWLKQLNEPRK